MLNTILGNNFFSERYLFIKSTLSLVLFLGGTNMSFAQKVQDDIVQINKVYEEAPYISMDILYAFYFDKDASMPSEQRKGQFKKNKQFTLTRIEGTQTIQNDNYLFVVDKETKTILVSNPKTSSQVPMELNLNDVLSVCRDIRFSEPNKGKGRYDFYFKNDAEYASVAIVFDRSNYFISQVVIYFNKAMPIDANDENSAKKVPKVVITYNNIDMTSIPGAASFSETEYFIEKEGLLKLKPQYKAYSLVDHRVSK